MSYFGIGIDHTKTSHNVGTLWRTADLFGASFVFTIGRRYSKQSSDTMGTTKRIPLYHYQNAEELFKHIPSGCQIVGIELDERAVELKTFQHPKRAIYLLGAEDNGLTKTIVERCHQLVKLPGRASMNVAVAGSIVIYDRWQKVG